MDKEYEYTELFCDECQKITTHFVKDDEIVHVVGCNVCGFLDPKRCVDKQGLMD